MLLPNLQVCTSSATIWQGITLSITKIMFVNLQTGDVGILSLKANCFSLLFLLLITFASITMESINIPTMINSDTPHAKPVITFPETE